MTPRTVNRLEVTRSQGPRHCDYPTCNRATKARKPFCNEHVECNPYVQHVLSVISDREREEKKVERKGWRAVDIKGSIAQEILQFIRVNGERTFARVARDMGRDSSITDCYLMALKKAKLVIVGRSKRGAMTIQAV